MRRRRCRIAADRLRLPARPTCGPTGRTIGVSQLPPDRVTTSGLSFVGDDRALIRQVGRLFDMQLEHEDDLARLAASGLSVRAFNEFSTLLPLPKRLVRSVLHRQRRGAGLRLSPIETEAVLRIARAYARTQLVIADDARAFAWFTTPATYLEGYSAISPLELSMTETGARLIDARLHAHAGAASHAAAADALAPAHAAPSTRSAARNPIDNAPAARL